MSEVSLNKLELNSLKFQQINEISDEDSDKCEVEDDQQLDIKNKLSSISISKNMEVMRFNYKYNEENIGNIAEDEINDYNNIRKTACKASTGIKFNRSNNPNLENIDEFEELLDPNTIDETELNEYNNIRMTAYNSHSGIKSNFTSQSAVLNKQDDKNS